METEIKPEVVTKFTERIASFGNLVSALSVDMKEVLYNVRQYEAKRLNLESQIVAKKAEIAELDEVIRRKKVDAAGSFNGIRDELTKREISLTKREAELKIRENNVSAKAAAVDNLMIRAEKVLDKAPATREVKPVVEEANAPDASLSAAVVEDAVKRGPGRPRVKA